MVRELELGERLLVRQRIRQRQNAIGYDSGRSVSHSFIHPFREQLVHSSRGAKVPHTSNVVGLEIQGRERAIDLEHLGNVYRGAVVDLATDQRNRRDGAIYPGDEYTTSL